jgi:hypothetical protein
MIARYPVCPQAEELLRSFCVGLNRGAETFPPPHTRCFRAAGSRVVGETRRFLRAAGGARPLPQGRVTNRPSPHPGPGRSKPTARPVGLRERSGLAGPPAGRSTRLPSKGALAESAGVSRMVRRGRASRTRSAKTRLSDCSRTSRGASNPRSRSAAQRGPAPGALRRLPSARRIGARAKGCSSFVGPCWRALPSVSDGNHAEEMRLCWI